MRLIAILLCGSLAQAQPRELNRLTTVGDDAFAHGFYGEALIAYQDLFQLTKEPSFLLKIGSCYEHLGNLSDAAANYRRYLAEEPALSAGERAQLEAKAASLERRRLQVPLVPSPAPQVTAAPSRPDHVVGLRRAVLASAAVTAALAVIAGGVTIGAADAFSSLGADCRGRTGGCNDNAAGRVLALDHAADAMWTLAAAGAIATVTLHLILRHERRR